MSNQLSTKVRLVKCPKCRQLLAELPNVLLYKCGGCGTVLQAKNRKKDNVAKSLEDNVPEEKESRRSNHDSISQHEPSVSNEISSSLEISSRLDDSSVEVKESSKQEQEETLGQTSETRDSKLRDHENSHEDENENVSANVEDSKSFVSFYLSSSDDERVDEKLARNFERVSSELSVKHGTNYTRAESYYGYDASESSCDDQILERISRPSIKIKGSDYITTTERLQKNGLRANDVASGERVTNYRALKNRDFGGNKMRLDKQGVVSSGLRFTSRDVVSGPRTRPNLAPARPVFRPSLEPSTYSQPDTMDILRTVCEIKEQLNRMHFPTNRLVLPCHRGWPEQHNVPRMALSGNQVSCSCSHCCPRYSHYSAQLPSNCTNCRNGHCRGPTEPYTSSELSLHGIETKAKRHIRPVAGGAPFVTCYYCSELLKLPYDFFLFEKKYHRLMCNACRKVLKFSILERTRIVPYCNNDTSHAPPPSEADECNNTSNFAPVSHSSSCQHVGPVSCFDDYGRSLCQSCSTSFDKGETNAYDRKMSLGSSYEHVEDREMKSILRESKGNEARSSPKVPKWRKPDPEIEPSNSPLHRLMGYSSASQVLNE